MQTDALYYDGTTSQAYAATLQLTPEHLAIELEDGTKFNWAADDVKLVEPPTSSTPLRLRCGFEDDARLLIEDPARFEDFKRIYPHIAKGENLWGKNSRRLIIWGSAAVASVAFTVLVAVPIIAQQVAENLPPSFERKMGREASEQIIKAVAFLEKRNPETKLVCGVADDPGNKALSRLINRLKPAQTGGLSPVLKVVDLKMENAFALPGGHMVLFRGLLDKMEGAEELAGVLAHELGHLRYNHSTKIFIERTGTSVLIGMLFGDVTGGTALAGIGQALLNSAHTRDAEREADTFALETLNRENIRSEPTVRFFERLDAQHGNLEQTLGLLNTHPMSTERAQYFAENGTGTRTAMPDRDWKAIKSVCDKN